MTVYKADFLDLMNNQSKKQGKAKKISETENEEPEVERATQGGKQLPPPPVKKPKTEKQLAALERARENRKRKREETEAAESKAVEDAKAAVAAKEAELVRKKEEQKEKRRLKKEAKAKESSTAPPPPPSTNDEISEAVNREVENLEKEVKVRKPKKAKVVNESVDEPPVWFKKYIEGLAIEKNSLSKDKRSVQEVKKESKQVATQAWGDDMTRDKVNQEKDNHMSRMYSSIFGSKLM